MCLCPIYRLVDCSCLTWASSSAHRRKHHHQQQQQSKHTFITHQMKRIHAIHWYQSRFDIYIFLYVYVRLLYGFTYVQIYIWYIKKESSLAHNNCGVKWSNEKLLSNHYYSCVCVCVCMSKIITQQNVSLGSISIIPSYHFTPFCYLILFYFTLCI